MLRRVLVADDHPLCTAALTLTVHSIDSAVAIDPVVSLSEAIEAIEKTRYDAVLLDLGLKDSQGLANLSAIRNLNKKVPILIVSGNDALHIIARAKSLGANGFLSKSASVGEMRDAVAAVLRGQTHFPALPDSDDEGDAEVESILERLSPAQTKVLIELAQGHSNKIIADNLELSEATVKSHMSAIFRVLGVASRAQAILTLRESGVTS